MNRYNEAEKQHVMSTHETLSMFPPKKFVDLSFYRENRDIRRRLQDARIPIEHIVRVEDEKVESG